MAPHGYEAGLSGDGGRSPTIKNGRLSWGAGGGGAAVSTNRPEPPKPSQRDHPVPITYFLEISYPSHHLVKKPLRHIDLWPASLVVAREGRCGADQTDAAIDAIEISNRLENADRP